MAASATDKLMNVGLSTATTLSAPGYTAGGTSINVAATTNWPTDTGIIFAIDTVSIVNGVEVQDAGTYCEFQGTVASATSITNVDYVDGNGDQNFAAGSTTRVYIPVSKTRENRIVTWGTAEHAQDGTHAAVTATSVNVSGTVTTDTIAEKTAATGVTIDGLLLKDSKLATNNSVVTANITDAAVTVAKRTGGFYVGTFVVSATGNQSVTGVGFTPKLVEFHGSLDAGNQSSSNFAFGQGFMTTAGQWAHWGNVTEGGDASGGGNWTTSCFATGDPNSDIDVAFGYVSMDADGFTVNVSSAESATRVGFVAYG